MTTPIFADGFDQYGAPGVSAGTLFTLLQQYWTTLSNSNLAIAAGLSSTGYALQLTGQNFLNKTLQANYSRIIGTHRFKSDLGFGAGTHNVKFRDTTNDQCTLVVEGSGTINLRSGNTTGTILSGAAGVVTANSTHVLSWDITFGTSGAYQVWLDGTPLFSGSGNTRGGSTNNYANAITVGSITGNTIVAIDDFAMADGGLAFDGGMLTSNPRLETQIATSDVQTQFTNATILGEAYSLTPNTNAPGANQLFLRRYVPEVNETINSVSLLPANTGATAKFKACVFADSAGSPNGQARLSDGTEVIGCTSGAILTGALVTPVNAVAGTAYWLGMISDTSIGFSQNDTGASGVRAAVTYTSGVPATCPTVTTGQPNWIIYGNCTGAAVNWPAVKHNPAPGDVSFAASATVNNEDLYGFPALSTTPTSIFFGMVMANVKRTDAGARTLDLRMKSSTTDSAGSNAGQSPALSYGWLTSFFPLDPNTGVAWTPSGWNAASAGMKIAA